MFVGCRVEELKARTWSRCALGGWLVQVVVVRSAAMEVSGEPVHLVTLVAKDGALDEQLDARILLPSDLLKSMLPEDRE